MAIVEPTINQVVSRRLTKKQKMQWTLGEHTSREPDSLMLKSMIRRLRVTLTKPEDAFHVVARQELTGEHGSARNRLARR